MEKILEQNKLLPLVTITELRSISILENILAKSGIKIVEVAYRSDLAGDAIQQLAKNSDQIVGAGTVRNIEQAVEAINYGAKFIVTPALIPEIVKYCQSKNIPILAGVLTPTEIQQGMDLGLQTFKIFPANIIGGLNGIKSLSGPYFDVNFVPTGGIDINNYTEYLKHPRISCVGGSFIITSDDLLSEDIAVAVERIKDLRNNVE